MQPCEVCGSTAVPVSAALGVCRACIIRRPEEAREVYWPRRAALRVKLGLPITPPRSRAGVLCERCANRCRLAPGETGFCGVRRNRAGSLAGGDPAGAAVHWYRDALPTNCVADEVCGERGTTGGHNLAVFYYGCSFDCLYCQNWQHKQWPRGQPLASAHDLAEAVDPDTACICYFGGDPTPHLPHSIDASVAALSRKPLRLCWETNGSMQPPLLERIAALALESGGTIKVDCKAWNPTLHRAMCGVSNEQVLETIRYLASLRRERPNPPLLAVSTLLVPGYVTTDEVADIAAFLASLADDIPYRLLCFAPQYAMRDLPATSADHARRATAASRHAGLREQSLGNVHLLR
jgi:pyruvate formate lyase activating enzyme